VDGAWWEPRTRVASALLSALDEGSELVVTADREVGRRSLPNFLELVAHVSRSASNKNALVHLLLDGSPTPATDGERRHRIGSSLRDWRLTA